MNINSTSIVSKKERDSLKEIIFSRVTERAESLQEEIENQYTDKAQCDVMNLAKASFVAEKNPFSMGFSTIVEDNEVNEIIAEDIEDDKNDTIGFEIKEHKSILQKKNILEETFVQSEITKNMIDARCNLENKKSFMGALNFLNSQATISLISKRNGRFEANV